MLFAAALAPMVIPQIARQFTGLPSDSSAFRPRRAAAPRPRSAERFGRQPALARQRVEVITPSSDHRYFDDVIEIKLEEMIFDALRLGISCLADYLRCDQRVSRHTQWCPHPDDPQPQRGVLA
jgi:hypothetical protein